VGSQDGIPNIYVVSPDGSDRLQLTADDAGELTPRWSPSGGSIAFLSTRDGNQELYIMNPDGTGLLRLTNSPGAETTLAWRPVN
jgi:TolB protein